MSDAHPIFQVDESLVVLLHCIAQALSAAPTDPPAASRQSSDEDDVDDQAANLGEFGEATESLIAAIQQALDRATQFDHGCPQRLAEAIRYAVLAPGKRLRPLLVLMAAEACGGSTEVSMPGAVAVEMIHAYSLIHDDLPSMDDDDLRRGRPTLHIAFDEATAVLAGDALQPLAFEHLCQNVSDPNALAEAVAILARAAGPANLVGGQVDDLAAESGRLDDHVLAAMADCDHCNGTDEHSDSSRRSQSRQTVIQFLESVHRRKTGALFAASLDLGAVLSSADDRSREALTLFAADLGLAFQVVDDILDHTSDERTLGKRTNKDTGRGKLTYPRLMGLQQARQYAEDLIVSAKRRLELFGRAAWRLNTLADYVLSRTR